MGKLKAIGLTAAQARKLATLAHGHIRSQAPGATARTVSAEEITYLVVQHAAYVAAHPGERITSTRVGGFVPNAYGYPGASDFVRITTDETGTTWEANRGRASSRPYGRGATVIHRAARPGQTQGRVL